MDKFEIVMDYIEDLQKEQNLICFEMKHTKEINKENLIQAGITLNALEKQIEFLKSTVE